VRQLSSRLSPIFSRRCWQRPNAQSCHRRISYAELDGPARFPAQVSVDEPNAIDNATDRANRLLPRKPFGRPVAVMTQHHSFAPARLATNSALAISPERRTWLCDESFRCGTRWIAARCKQHGRQGLRLPTTTFQPHAGTYLSEGAQARRAIM